MQVGELFISLGVKGADKTVMSINNVSTSIKQTASVSLEAKAAILGAMYALEQFFSKSGAAGSALTNFNTLTGISTQQLQEYQYAAKQVGVSNEDTANTFKNLQSAMEKQALGVSRVATWSQLSAKLGGTLGINDVNKFAKDPSLLIQKLQQYAQIEQDIAKRNETLRGFGVSDNMIAALSKGAFNQDAFAKAPKYNEREIAALDRANTAWGNINDKIAMAVGRFNAAHGEQLAKTFGQIVNLGLKLADVLLKVAERAGFFKAMDTGFDNLINRTNSVINAIEAIGKSLTDIIGKFREAFRQTSILSSVSSMLQSFAGIDKSIVSITTAILGLVSSTKILGTEMSAFQIVAQGIDLIFQGWAIIFRGIASTLSAAAQYLSPSTAPGTAAATGTPGVIDEVKGMLSYGLRTLLGTENMGPPPNPNTGQPPKLSLVPPPSGAPRVSLNVPPAPLVGNSDIAAPKVPLQVVKQANGNQVTVNQNLNFQHEGKDSFRTANDVSQAAKNAVNQMKINQVN